MDNTITDLETKLEKILKFLKLEFSTLHSIGAHPDLLIRVKVNYYDSLMPLNQLANIKAPDATQLIVTPYDKGALKAIADAINKANIGLNPVVESDLIRISVPPMNQEKRMTYIKKAKEMGENAKIQVRNTRHDILKKVAQLKLSENEKELLEKEIQDAVLKYNKLIDESVKQKQKQLSII